MTAPTTYSGVVLDRSVRTFRDGTVLVGGHPGRLIALSRHGAEALRAWLGGGRPTAAVEELGRRLVVAGMVHPLATPPLGPGGADEVAHPDVTVVVPVRDRPEALERCLRSLGHGPPVAVVDDGSEHPDALAEVCDRHGATLIRLPENAGPGAARNRGLASVSTDLTAFVDSDCEVTEGWLDGLTWLFADPDVAAVAPRVRPRTAGPTANCSARARYSVHRSPLDMGSDPSEVGPGRTVGYVPTTALVVRRGALVEVGGFDESLRVGEDVDLVWRLLERGWRVRYEPTVTVSHAEPPSWPGLLGRRFRYGTSAAPLSHRHPGRLAPLEFRPWPTGVTVAIVARRPVAALVVLSGSTWSLARQVRRFGVPRSMALRWSAQGALSTGIGLGHALTVLAGPALIVGALRSRRWAITAAVLVAAPPLAEWWHKRPSLDPLRWCLSAVADDVAYGAGVWWGCIRGRTVGPLVPSVRFRTPGAVPEPDPEAVGATPSARGEVRE